MIIEISKITPWDNIQIKIYSENSKLLEQSTMKKITKGKKSLDQSLDG